VENEKCQTCIETEALCALAEKTTVSNETEYQRMVAAHKHTGELADLPVFKFLKMIQDQGFTTRLPIPVLEEDVAMNYVWFFMPDKTEFLPRATTYADIPVSMGSAMTKEIATSNIDTLRHHTDYTFIRVFCFGHDVSADWHLTAPMPDPRLSLRNPRASVILIACGGTQPPTAYIVPNEYVSAEQAIVFKHWSALPTAGSRQPNPANEPLFELQALETQIREELGLRPREANPVLWSEFKVKPGERWINAGTSTIYRLPIFG
jgi:hypothetical protein